jgi:hypothetical protein
MIQVEETERSLFLGELDPIHERWSACWIYRECRIGFLRDSRTTLIVSTVRGKPALFYPDKALTTFIAGLWHPAAHRLSWFVLRVLKTHYGKICRIY